MGNDKKQHIYAAWSDAIPNLVKIGISKDAENRLNGANANAFVPGFVDGFITQVDDATKTVDLIYGILQDFRETKEWFAITREHATSVLQAFAIDFWEYAAREDTSESGGALASIEDKEDAGDYPKLGKRSKAITWEELCQKAGFGPGAEFTSNYKGGNFTAELLSDYKLRCNNTVGTLDNLCHKELGITHNVSARTLWKYEGKKLSVIVQELRSKDEGKE